MFQEKKISLTFLEKSQKWLISTRIYLRLLTITHCSRNHDPEKKNKKIKNALSLTTVMCDKECGHIFIDEQLGLVVGETPEIKRTRRTKSLMLPSGTPKGTPSCDLPLQFSLVRLSYHHNYVCRKVRRVSFSVRVINETSLTWPRVNHR